MSMALPLSPKPVRIMRENDSANAPRATTAPPVHDARRLTGADGTAAILLDGQPYVLRITRARKLILTK